MKNSAKYFNLNFVTKEKVSADAFSFYFDRVNRDSKEKFNFLAGQYIHMYLPVVNEKGRGNSRMFTISSSPLEKDYVAITTKKGNSIFKKSLFNLTPQMPVKFYGPSGSLTIDDSPAGGKKSSYVFLASGIGITPFRSIIKFVSQKNLKIPITLLTSFSKKENFLFFQELLEISKSNQNIKVVYTLNRISDGFIKKYIKNINKHAYFIVGAPSGVSDLEEMLYRMGIVNGRIFIEDFEGY